MVKIPKDLKLPSHYKEWREDQAETVDDIVVNNHPCYLLDGPTGSGKSLVAIASYKRLTVPDEVLARMTDDHVKFRCVYLTRTKQLQQQLCLDFNAAEIKGRSNYTCTKSNELTAAECPGVSCDYCAYKYAKSLAVKAPLAVLNDTYFLTEANGPSQFSGANMVVLDEIDSIESSLMDYIKFTVSERQCKQFGLKPPDEMESLPSWIFWAEQATGQVFKSIQTVKEQLPLGIEDWTDLDIENNREIKRAEAFLNQMRLFVNEVNDTWILDLNNKTKAGWQVVFKPIMVGQYCQRYLWRHGKRFLGMSGTILDPEILANDLGIENYVYKRLESHFPVQNRWIHYRPVANLKYDRMDQELPKLTEAVASAILANLPENILVHTTSYAIRDHLMQMLPLYKIDPDVLMTHDSNNRAEQLEIFKKSNSGPIHRPKVMISPSFDRGVSLDDEACRCVLICKMPYMSLGDKQVKARLKLPRDSGGIICARFKQSCK